MKLVPISIEHLSGVMSENQLLCFIGRIAGECYGSAIDENKCINRALNCIARGHHSPWEHYNVTIKCTVDRGTSHALVRHRHCAFQQSSTIYQKYDELCIIKQDDISDEEIMLYNECEENYIRMTQGHIVPSRARDILPNALATNLIITTNIRQWMYMIQRRCGPGDSNNMHEWCKITRKWFENYYPRITAAFDEWYNRHPL